MHHGSRRSGNSACSHRSARSSTSPAMSVVKMRPLRSPLPLATQEAGRKAGGPQGAALADRPGASFRATRAPVVPPLRLIEPAPPTWRSSPRSPTAWRRRQRGRPCRRALRVWSCRTTRHRPSWNGWRARTRGASRSRGAQARLMADLDRGLADGDRAASGGARSPSPLSPRRQHGSTAAGRDLARAARRPAPRAAPPCSLDATQSAGVLPLDVRCARSLLRRFFDLQVVARPYGRAFLYVAKRHQARHSAGADELRAAAPCAPTRNSIYLKGLRYHVRRRAALRHG